ncbi:GNAT family N-acetyltransferase [Henriciella marina]|uniref:GNAT family N-acetyltransferase n=1 Tax=Henriciella marina TaxID=453851 RepID=UPI00036926F0|nr:GNAT family N-acetyltransferase [Henriciella marina]
MALMIHPAAGWKIRSYRRDDDVDLETLFLDCLDAFPWRGGPAEELIRLRQAIRTTRCIVAEEPNAGVVGFLTLEREKAYVPHLFVALDWRFCGIGAGLLDVARDLARAPLSLDVDTQNESAMKAYMAMGWTEKVDAPGGRPGQVRLNGP